MMTAAVFHGKQPLNVLLYKDLQNEILFWMTDHDLSVPPSFGGFRSSILYQLTKMTSLIKCKGYTYFLVHKESHEEMRETGLIEYVVNMTLRMENSNSCSCFDGNKLAKDPSACFLKTHNAVISQLCFMDISEISLKYCTNLETGPVSTGFLQSVAQLLPKKKNK